VEFKLLATSDPESVRQLEAVERCKEWLAQYPGVIDIDDDSRRPVGIPGQGEAAGRGGDGRSPTFAATIRASFSARVIRLSTGPA